MSGVHHTLTFAVRFFDHFSGQAVPQELPVRLATGRQKPVKRQDGTGHRQADGTYRFRDAPPGNQEILWREPFRRTQAGWTRWEAADPSVTLPVADPTVAEEIELWPTADAAARAGATGIRGKLTGPDPDGLEVRIALQGQPFDRVTRSDQAGEFLFLPPGSLPLNAARRVPLTIETRLPGGAPRAVAGATFHPSTAGADFVGADFTVLPNIVSRVIFQLA